MGKFIAEVLNVRLPVAYLEVFVAGNYLQFLHELQYSLGTLKGLGVGGLLGEDACWHFADMLPMLEGVEVL